MGLETWLWFRTFAAFPRDPSLVPGIHVRQFTMAYNSSSGWSDTLWGPLWSPIHMWIYWHRSIKIKTIVVTFIFLLYIINNYFWIFLKTGKLKLIGLTNADISMQTCFFFKLKKMVISFLWCQKLSSKFISLCPHHLETFYFCFYFIVFLRSQAFLL